SARNGSASARMRASPPATTAASAAAAAPPPACSSAWTSSATPCHRREHRQGCGNGDQANQDGIHFEPQHQVERGHDGAAGAAEGGHEVELAGATAGDLFIVHQQAHAIG